MAGAEETIEVSVQSMCEEGSNVTLSKLMELMTTCNKGIVNVQTTLDGLTKRVDSIEEKQTQQAKDISVIQQEQEAQLRRCEKIEKEHLHDRKHYDEALEDIDDRIKRIHETQNRQWRVNNIIIHGVKECSGDMKVVEDILHIIYGKEVKSRIVRVGNGQRNRIRPLRVRLCNSEEVLDALKKSNTLKNYAEYKGIYVTPDETPDQQANSKRKRQEYARQKLLEEEEDYDEEDPEYVSRMPKAATSLAMRKRRREAEMNEDFNTSRPSNFFMRANHETTPITSKPSE